MATSVGDEGGFAPDLKSSEEALETDPGGHQGRRLQAGRRRSRSPSTWRPASSTRARSTSSRSRAARSRRPDQMVAMYEKWVKAYPIVSIEDGVGEKDWPGWKALTEALGAKVQLVGDDLFVTNPEILARGHRGGHRELRAGQGQPDRHPDRDPRLRGPGHPRRLHLHDEPPQRRDRGRHHRRPRGGHQLRADQDRLRLAHATAWRSTTSSCASRRSWARWRATRAGPPSTRGRSPQRRPRRRAWARRLQRARAAICAIWLPARRGQRGRAGAAALQAAPPAEGGGVHAEAERPAALGEGHRAQQRRGRMAPGAIRLRIREPRCALPAIRRHGSGASRADGAPSAPSLPS